MNILQIELPESLESREGYDGPFRHFSEIETDRESFGRCKQYQLIGKMDGKTYILENLGSVFNAAKRHARNILSGQVCTGRYRNIKF